MSSSKAINNREYYRNIIKIKKPYLKKELEEQRNNLSQWRWSLENRQQLIDAKHHHFIDIEEDNDDSINDDMEYVSNLLSELDKKESLSHLGDVELEIAEKNFARDLTVQDIFIKDCRGLDVKCTNEKDIIKSKALNLFADIIEYQFNSVNNLNDNNLNKLLSSGETYIV